MYQNEENDFLARLLFAFNAMLIGFTGGYFVVVGDISYSTPTYNSMSELLPLWAYGLVLVGVSALHIRAAVCEGDKRYWSMTIAGSVGGILFALYATASFEGTHVILLPMRYAVISGINLIIAGVGGYALWSRKH